jgi:putative tryptophan/tyrosine transport system substrate-binding protein
LRLLTSLIIVLTLLSPILAEAYEVLVVMSKRHPIYEEAFSGFGKAGNFSRRVIYLSDYAETDISRVVREDRPSVILAIGDRAFEITGRVRKVPIISLMAFRFHKNAGTASNITGVEFFVKPEPNLQLLSEMRCKRVGVFFNPDGSGDYLNRARQAAGRYGMDLVAIAVDTPKDTAGQLINLKGRVDGLWMIPDPHVVNQNSAEALLLFSLGQKIPVVSFDRHYLDLGAAAIIEADRGEMGRQAGEMALALLNGTPISELPPVLPRKFIIRNNPNVLKRLGIPDGAAEK